MRAERLTDQIGEHLEGPVWWQATEELRLVDMFAGDILAVEGDQVVARMPVGSSIAACLRPRAGGGAIVATERDLRLADAEDLSDLRTVVTVQPETTIRNNEGGCDPLGRFFVGTMGYERVEGTAALYRYAAGESTVTTVRPRATIANGVGWSPDGRLAYWNDTPTGAIRVFDVDTEGELSDERILYRFREDDGSPDGLTVDVEGGIWCAGNGGGCVVRIDPAGALSERIEVGARQVTACTFGGVDLDQLVITTSRENLADADDPAAGSLFVAQPGVQGQQSLPFAG